MNRTRPNLIPPSSPVVLTTPAHTHGKRPNNKLHLHAPNRPKVTDRLLLRKPHGASYRRNHNPNPMIILKRPNPNGIARTNLLRAILPSQHHL
uniref:Uncharacterized protein n=1 Tax=Athene cunicularia TaxID=194338 RepID=A0A663MRG5_ATHCN